jgi:hypothetical protein
MPGVGNDVSGSGAPVMPVRVAPVRARAALSVEPAAPVRLVAVGVARAPVRPELLRPVRRPVVRFAAARRFAGRRLAVVFRLAAVFRLAVVRLAAVLRFAVVFRFAVVRLAAVLRFAVVFRLAVVRFAAVLRLAVVRFAAVLRLAVVRFAAVLRFAVVRFAAVFRLAVVRLAVVRFAAGRRFAVDRFAAVRFVPVLFLVAICLLLLGEFGGNDRAQYARTIGRFHHLERRILRKLEIFSSVRSTIAIVFDIVYDLRADARPPFRPAAFFCAVLPPCEDVLRRVPEPDDFPPRLEAPGEFAIRAARAFDIPFSFSFSYCFSFLTLGLLVGIDPSCIFLAF